MRRCYILTREAEIRCLYDVSNVIVTRVHRTGHLRRVHGAVRSTVALYNHHLIVPLTGDAISFDMTVLSHFLYHLHDAAEIFFQVCYCSSVIAISSYGGPSTHQLSSSSPSDDVISAEHVTGSAAAD